MLFAELIPLCDSIQQLHRHITIETAGTLYLPVRCDLMSISPKLSNSAPDRVEYPKWHHRHEVSRNAPEIVRRLVDEYDCQFKFVVDTHVDVDEILVYLEAFSEINRAQVMLMPQARNVQEQQRIAEWLVPRCDSEGLQFCPRKQIDWFGLSRGT